MFHFFRRYERYFFIAITIMIVISFSFFGTFNSVGSNSWREQLAFTAVNGKEIPRMEVENMAVFLSTDNDDKRNFGGAWGPNFLNDGVIRKDILQTGLGAELVRGYLADLQEDLDARLIKEKKYTPYAHPQARFLSVPNAWNYLMPELNQQFNALRSETDAASPSAFNSRVQLYLAEKQFPANLLRQVLRHQEKQQSWIEPDRALDQTDLSLFGYHTLPDWFGTKFVHLVSQFIINASIVAESKGYTVSKSEVMADLIRQTDLSYQQNKNNSAIGVRNPAEYFNEQLRYMGMDQASAVKVWERVLLFRRYFHDAGSSALTDVLPFIQYSDYANQALLADVYRLPASLRFGDATLLQNLEVYLNSATKRPKGNLLALPTDYLSIAEVEKTAPELVQKQYVLEVAQVNKKALQSRVGIKEMWNWEVSDQNWAELKKKFPDLGIKEGKTREERFEALENLDNITRAKIDSVAKEAIVDAHPEWLTEALSNATPKKMSVGLRTVGGKLDLLGIDSKEKRQELIKLADNATLNEQSEKLAAFTGDNKNYYRIVVVERSPEKEIVTFAEANKDGTLDQLRDKLLEKHYLANREKNPTQYQNADKSWKKFNDVRDLVAIEYSEKLLEEIQKQKGLPKIADDKKTISKDQLASLRFYTYVNQILETLKKDPAQAEKWTRSSGDSRTLADQWLLEKTERRIEKNGRDIVVDQTEAFSLPMKEWSKVQTPTSGDLAFFQVKAESLPEDKEKQIAEQTIMAQAMLSAEVQQSLMKGLLNEISSKNAMSLGYLNKVKEE